MNFVFCLLQLRAEKEKFAHWKDKLERERNEAYAQVRIKFFWDDEGEVENLKNNFFLFFLKA